MTQHVQLDHGDPAHEGFFDAIQELLGAAAPNFRVAVLNDTTLELDAGTGNDQQGIAIEGRYRWRTTDTTAALPGALPDGEHPVFVTASDNNFGGPLSDPDESTDYTFGLQIKKTGETPATAIYRLIGYVTVAGGKITAFRQLVNRVSGAQIANGAFSTSGDLEWTREQSGAWVPQLKANSVGEAEIAPDSVGNSEMKNEAITDVEVATANKDGEASKASMRTLGTGAKQAAAGNDARLSDERTPKAASVTAAKMGTLPQARVRKTSATAIGAGDDTFLTFPTEDYDTDGMHSTVSNTGRLTCVTPGLYLFHAHVRLNVGGTGEHTLGFRIVTVSGNDEIFGGQTVEDPGHSYSGSGISTTAPRRMVAGDYVEVVFFSLAGTDLDAQDAAVENIEYPTQLFECHFLSA